VDQPDFEFLDSVGEILRPGGDMEKCRKEMAQKFLDLHGAGEITSGQDKPIITSRNDNLLHCFSSEYTALLSHRKSVEGINPEELRNGFFQRQNNLKKYEECSDVIREQVETILGNMVDRFDYPEEIALDTVVYSIRKGIIDFAEILS
ncbi:MAG: hypothetical protein AAGH89_18220, partial [Verrucomicrobiota bacterium]